MEYKSAVSDRNCIGPFGFWGERRASGKRSRPRPTIVTSAHYGIILTISQFEVWEATTDGQMHELRCVAQECALSAAISRP
ncbi:MAG: hypothetical protein M1816_003516 [Peltula sp. TS41687]|nr:MAG: hypothetical protein M1816_003516 [Peltula sp. TS41687]